MNLVVGATGYLGSTVCRQLAAEGGDVTAMVRRGDDDARVQPLRSAGVHLVQGDLKDRLSLERACAGQQAVISTASSSISRQGGDTIQSVDLDGQRSLIDAAVAAGVSHFVYIAFSKNMTTESPINSAKRAVERHLQASGLDFTILRCSFFMEIMISPFVGFDFANAKATLYGTGDAGISFVSLGDVAKMVAACVNQPQSARGTIDFGGPEPVTLRELVRISEEVAGRPFEVAELPEDVLIAQWEQATDPFAKSRAGVFLDYAHGDLLDVGPALNIFPLPFTSVRDFARTMLGAP